MEQLLCAYHFTYWFRQCNVKHLQIWGCHGTEYWDSSWNVTFFLHLETALKMKAAFTGMVVSFCHITVLHSRRLNHSMQKCCIERTISKLHAHSFQYHVWHSAKFNGHNQLAVTTGCAMKYWCLTHEFHFTVIILCQSHLQVQICFTISIIYWIYFAPFCTHIKWNSQNTYSVAWEA